MLFVKFNRKTSILRRATLTLIAVSAFSVFALAQQTAALTTSATAPGDVSLTSPLDYQVFQRETRLRGIISIRGRSAGSPDKVEARIVGRSTDSPLAATWQKLSLDRHTGEFYGDLETAAGGFYEIDIRVRHGRHRVETLTVPHVGVGEVFVVSGQSNSTNYGEVPQVTETGMVTTFNGEAWCLANDPQPGVQDNSKKGSFIPAFGDALYRKYQVPIGVASVGHGSTSVRQWLPAGEFVEVMPTMTKYVIQTRGWQPDQRWDTLQRHDDAHPAAWGTTEYVYMRCYAKKPSGQVEPLFDECSFLPVKNFAD
jgi:hypothetical protein